MNPRVALANMSKGEIGPQLLGRFDVDSYQSALKRARNVVVMKYGGVTKRPGTFYCADARGTGPRILVPFQFSLLQGYVLELGHNYMSPLAAGGRVVNGATPVQITSPYTAAQLSDLDWAQTADTLYTAHLEVPPSKLVRASHVSWAFSTVVFGAPIPAPSGCTGTAYVNNTDAANSGDSYMPQAASYCVTAVNDDTGYESVSSNAVVLVNDLTLKRNYNTISWTTNPYATRYNVYKADNSQFFGYLGTTDTTAFTDDNIAPALDRSPPLGNAPFAGAGNYPSTVLLFEQRSFWARTLNTPNAIYFSRVGALENMDRSRPTRADDSGLLAIVSNQVNLVNQLAATSTIIALTSDGIFTVDGDGNGGVITADSAPAARRQIGRGASRLNPLVVDNVIFYTPGVGSSVRSINYSFEQDGLRSSDVTIFSPHFFDGHTIVSWCYAQEPRSIIWAVREDGVLLAFTWEQDQNVWGWTLCETLGSVKSVACISEGGEDRVYLLVERTLGGVTKAVIERMDSAIFTGTQTSCFLDCAISASFVTPRATFTGLDHLNGRTDVAGVVDGVPVTGLTVTGGSLTLPETIGTGKVVTFGLPYTAEIETLPLRIQTQMGSNLGRQQQAGEIVLSLIDTGPIEAGIDAAHLFPVKSRTNEAYGAPDSLFNGEYIVSSDNKAGTNVSAFIRSSLPLPFTVIGVALDPVING